MKLAAIDIGSNAARLLITDVRLLKKNKPEFIKSNLIRVPLRLGFDVFETGMISANKISHILSTMKAYRNLLDAYEVQHIKACATSAMRDARNGAEIIKQVKETTGIEIEIISGDREAALIYESHVADSLTRDESYLYIDVGGGSTELTCFTNGTMTFKRSFNIGTIRILKQQVTEAHWEEMKTYIRSQTKKPDLLSGSGRVEISIRSFHCPKEKKEGPLRWSCCGITTRNSAAGRLVSGSVIISCARTGPT